MPATPSPQSSDHATADLLLASFTLFGLFAILAEWRKQSRGEQPASLLPHAVVPLAPSYSPLGQPRWWRPKCPRCQTEWYTKQGTVRCPHCRALA